MIQVLVATGGESVSADRLLAFGPFDAVVAADSGARLAVSLGLQPDLAIGDFDSVDEKTLRAIEGSRVVPHPSDKDQTDFELALSAAVSEFGADQIVVGGGGGGRLDHLLGNVAAIAAVTAVPVTWVLEREAVYPVRSRRTISTSAGATVSLIPHGPAQGVTTEGLRWQLDDEPLGHLTARGVSNVAEADTVTVEVKDGVVLVVVTS